MNAWTRYFLWMAGALMACVAVARADGQVTVRVDAPQKMYVGDTSDMQVVVTGSKNVTAPDLSGLRDFEVVYRGPQDQSSTMTTIANGHMDTRVSVTFAHVYAITPRRAGALEIPPISVAVDGKTYTTQAVAVEVAEAAKGDGFTLELTADHTRAFVGEPILVRMVWTIGPPRQVANVQFTLPIDGAEHEVMPGPLTRPLTGGGRGSAVVLFNGAQTPVAFDEHAATIDRVIVPKQAGKITIGSGRVDFLAVVGQKQRTGMEGFMFGSQPITERQFSSAAPIEIMVEDLPAAGKPANFSGLVGKYEITASANATNVSVGEPINLMVGVGGPFPLSLVPAMDFTTQKDLKSHFRVPREPVLATVTNSAAIFQGMIRARSDTVTAIDPVSLNFFDPDARQYRTVRSKPIPVTVRASTTVGLPDEPETAEPARPVQRMRPGGLPDLVRDGMGTGPGPLDLREAMMSRGTIALVATPPAVWMLVSAVIGLRRWRSRDPEGARRAAALRRLRRSLKRARGTATLRVASAELHAERGGTQVDAVARALANFAADWFAQPVDTLTGPAAARLLEQDGTAAGKRLADVIRACDVTRFGGRGTERPDAGGMVDEALGAARAFATEIRAVRVGRAA